MKTLSILLPKEPNGVTGAGHQSDADADFVIEKIRLKVWLKMEEGRVELFIRNQEAEKIIGFKLEAYIDSNIVSRQRVIFDRKMDLEPLAEENIRLGSLEYLKKHSMSKKEESRRNCMLFVQCSMETMQHHPKE